MAWKYSALQDKLSTIQSQLLATMEQRSDCQDHLMGHMSTNDGQSNHDLKGKSLKRRADDHCSVGIDNPKKSRPCLMMLDMYTQTDKTMNNEISLGEIYELMKQNCERLRKIEDILMKLTTTFEGVSENVLDARMMSQREQRATSTSHTKPTSATAVFTPSQSPTSPSRPSFVGPNSYPGVPSSSFRPSEGSQANEIEDWAQERDGMMTPGSTSSPTPELPLADGSPAEVKTPTKEQWGGEDSEEKPAILVNQEQPSGPGCWLGDVNDLTNRAWFSGDPQVINRCESYGVNPVKLALSLTEALFTREEMAASNVRGIRGKESLDPDKIKAIRAHVDYKYPIEANRMNVRWHLITPKLDSKCRSQRRLQREHKWRSERVSAKVSTPVGHRRQKRPVLNAEEREMLLYGGPSGSKTTASNPVVSAYTDDHSDTASFTEGQEGYLENHGD